MDQNLQNEILNTSIELFRTKGLKFTMLEVANAMHVAKKTIYKLYPSKEDLLMDMVVTGFARIQESKREILNSDLPMKEKISRVLIAMPDEYATLDFRNLKGIEIKYPEVWKAISQNLDSEWEPIYELLEEGMRLGVVRKISLPVLKQIVTSSIDSFLYTDGLKRSGILYQDALHALVEILMKGVWNDSAEQSLGIQ
ncbi:MAG: TetR/AcrR family transcriptional regulator [Solobacterium sp.]|nr:TetR/AcrR family transcriptional regulator [Solobacterium sp.]